MRAGLPAVIVASGLFVLQEGCMTSTHTDCSGGCPQSAPATFRLACTPNDLTTALASGPCTASDPRMSATSGIVDVTSTSPTTCQLQLTFATGFTYTTTVSFERKNNGCGCPDYIGPISGPTAVDNPTNTCVPVSGDAGAQG